MAHIAFMAPPAAGHVNPTLGIVSELVSRGHRVSYLVAKEYARVVEEVGAEAVTYRSTMPGPDAKRFTLQGFDVARGLLAGLKETRALSTELDGWFAEQRPDVVVFDGLVAWWGRLLAYRYGIPAVPCWPSLLSNDAWKLTDAYVRFNRLDPRLYWFIVRLAGLASKEGLDHVELMDSVGRGVHEHVVFLPREFQYAGETFEEEFRFVGPCLRPREGGRRWSSPPSDGPVLLVSLGTLYQDRPDLFRTVVEAFADTPWHVVQVIGPKVDPASLGPIPDNIEIHRSVPQLDVLERADLFLTHAGMGSVMEALYFGVPMIAAPQMGEQRANADRIVELGLGRIMPEGLSPEGLRRLATEVSDDAAVREAVDRMREVVRRSGGTEAAATVIEGALSATVR